MDREMVAMVVVNHKVRRKSEEKTRLEKQDMVEFSLESGALYEKYVYNNT